MEPEAIASSVAVGLAGPWPVVLEELELPAIAHPALPRRAAAVMVAIVRLAVCNVVCLS